MTYKLCVPCLFGLEGPVGNELRRMGMEAVAPENGRVRFESDAAGLIRANIRSRFGERVLLEVGSFEAKSFDDLFEGVKALRLENYIPRDGAFPVKGYSLDSQLHSVPDCQSIIKKAAAERLKSAYGISGMCAETGSVYQIQFSIMKDLVHIYLDSTGTGLHKRGYRPIKHAAPLRETLAAALVDVAGYRGRGVFYDPFCGSGTIAIEAAFAAKGRAPGLKRKFAAEHWHFIDKSLWLAERESAKAREFNGEYRIHASDIDAESIEQAKANAERAGVADMITFEVADARLFKSSGEGSIIVTNPPYGERLMEQREAAALYKDFGRTYFLCENTQLALLSSHTDFENCFGRTAQKRRKLYNGMIKCELYMYGMPQKTRRPAK